MDPEAPTATGPEPADHGVGAAAAPAPTPDLVRIGAELSEVEAALTRLDDGTYGRCGTCGAPIDDEALAEDPTTSTCAAHLQL